MMISPYYLLLKTRTFNYQILILFELSIKNKLVMKELQGVNHSNNCWIFLTITNVLFYLFFV